MTIDLNDSPLQETSGDEHTEAPISENDSAQTPEQAKLDIPSVLPVLPVRDIVVFNYMILPLFVGREKSVAAVDAALNSNRYILISLSTMRRWTTPSPKTSTSPAPWA